MKRILFLLLLPLSLFAQNDLLLTHHAIIFGDEASKERQMDILKAHGLMESAEVSALTYKPVVFVPVGSVNTTALLNEAEVEFISPVYTNEKHQFVAYKPNFFVHLHDENDFGILIREAEKLEVEVVGAHQFFNDIIELKTTKFGTGVLEAINTLKASNLFKTVSPNLMHTISDCLVNDPRYYRQWALKNEASPVQGNGVAGADMDVEAAWTVTTGSADLNLVIVDSGVDTLHPELLGKLLPGYDAMGDGTNGYPTPNYDSDGHGTCCAGIAAANTNNELGVAGVCQNCKVIPIRAFNYEDILGAVQPWSETAFFLNAMGWQNENDVDVSSNSWGVPDYLLALFPGSDTLVNAVIDDVVETGRGGLGVPMLFSSGNDGITDSIPIWPARYEKTIAVGATSMCDEHKSATSCDNESWWAGNWGEGLHVSAPGVRVATIDMLGSNGFNASEYYNAFNGTSSACPNAAGVVALMLSNTPSMTEAMARETLAVTSEKVGGYDYSNFKEFGFWSEELGYGRVNAYYAVIGSTSSIGGSDQALKATIETHADHYTVRFDKPEQRTWQLIDLNGRTVSEGSSNSDLRIEFSGIAKGIYALRVQSNGVFSTVKLVIP
ncbi:MAG: S8 family peptidase [Flavobacteriales bacterium]|nr:S8 family peptidase [Flavobacteriales bacterium]MCB9191007.1 S8 family peptidase [Flavobacteriales bacterium]MCB9204758.1 S8 family peptidase [Flavobacteriales bacterium]